MVDISDTVASIIEDWVDIGYRTASAGTGKLGCEPAQQEALDQIRHLQLAEPWLPAAQIMKALAIAGWTGPNE
jgi:hypothetical protein